MSKYVDGVQTDEQGNSFEFDGVTKAFKEEVVVEEVVEEPVVEPVVEEPVVSTSKKYTSDGKLILPLKKK